jgi:hypothetical protein
MLEIKEEERRSKKLGRARVEPERTKRKEYRRSSVDRRSSGEESSSMKGKLLEKKETPG